MADTFTNDLRLRLQESGANSGQWGTLLNTTISNIAAAFSLGSEAIANASTHTITLADGTADEARSMYLKCTGGGQACTVTLAPNTISKVWIISNETSFTLTFTQGSGANVAVAAGAVKIIVTDGAGSGAAVTDALSGLSANVSDLTTTGAVQVQSSGTYDVTSSGRSINGIDIQGTAGGSGAFAGGISFGVGATGRAAIAGLQGGSDADLVGLAFFIHNSSTGSADASEAMRITSTGVGIGTSPATTLDVKGASDLVASFRSSTNNGNASEAKIRAVDSDSSHVATFLFQGFEHRFQNASGTEAMRLSDGNLLVGKTARATNTAGIELLGVGASVFTYAGQVILANRLSNDGPIMGFAKDGTTVGSVGSISGVVSNIVLDPRSSLKGAGIAGASANASEGIINPTDRTGAFADGVISLGGSSTRWKNLYLSGGVYLGGTGTANKLDDYEEGTWTMSLTTSGSAPSISIENTTGNYTKIGNLVHVRIYSGALNITGAGSGGIRIVGLPFVVTSSVSAYSAASFAHTNCFTTEVEAYGAVGNNFLVAKRPNSITNAAYEVGNPRYLMFSLLYQTDE